MPCEITGNGECSRDSGHKYHCDGCSAFMTLAQGAVDGGGFTIIRDSVEHFAGLYRKRDGRLVMEVIGGKFRKKA